MKRIFEKTYQRVAESLPPAKSARLDMMRPTFWASWGGPLNGQQHRRAIVREIARSQSFETVIETGTYRGTTTEFLAAVFDCHIHTVEANPRFYEFSRRRLACLEQQVTVHLGDSRALLNELPPSVEPVFIYLDAHWEEDLPLREELEIIADKWPAAVVMIDDFQVPDDPGYAFDDYGPGRALVRSIIPDTLSSWTLLYPNLPAAEETGARRGSCVLVGPEQALKPLGTMREAAPA